jgi:hypothetical protein
MLKFLFGILTDPLGLPIDAIWEYLILAVIGAIAFVIAWNASPGGDFGSLIHWVVRLIAFVALWAIVYGFILDCREMRMREFKKQNYMVISTKKPRALSQSF